MYNHVVSDQSCALQSHILGSWLGQAIGPVLPMHHICLYLTRVFIPSSKILDPVFDAATLLGQ